MSENTSAESQDATATDAEEPQTAQPQTPQKEYWAIVTCPSYTHGEPVMAGAGETPGEALEAAKEAAEEDNESFADRWLLIQLSAEVSASLDAGDGLFYCSELGIRLSPDELATLRIGNATFEHPNTLTVRGEQVLNYLWDHPGATPRQVATDVFGGTGNTRTSERSYAHRELENIILAGRARVEKSGTSFTYWPLDVQDQSLRAVYLTNVEVNMIINVLQNHQHRNGLVAQSRAILQHVIEERERIWPAQPITRKSKSEEDQNDES